MSKKCVVIGSGISGLAIALRLAADGWQVDVFERNEHIGGKVNEVVIDGFRFDFGPTVLTMPWLIDDLFRLHDKDPRSYFKLHKLDEVSRYFFNDGKVVRAYNDSEKYAEELEKTIGIPKKNFYRFLQDAATKFNLTNEVFLKSSLHRLSNYTRWAAVKGILLFYKVGAFTTMAKWNRKLFQNTYMEQIVNRYAQYNGSHPYEMSSTFNVIAHVELGMGVNHIEGGMRRMIDSLLKLCDEVGVKISKNTCVDKIVVKDGKATGISINQKEIEYDLVVSNSDIYNTFNHLLDGYSIDKLKVREPSSSAVIFLWGVQGKYEKLGINNFLLGEKCKPEFDAIFKNKELPDDGAIYIHICSKLNHSDAPENCESWFVMMNAPIDNDQNWEGDVQVLREKMIKKISSLLDEDMEKMILNEKIYSPKDLEQSYLSFKGSIYGDSSNSIWSAFLRQKNYSSKIDHLYFTGGSVHPGSGIPLCLNSAEITANLIKEREKT